MKKTKLHAQLIRFLTLLLCAALCLGALSEALAAGGGGSSQIMLYPNFGNDLPDYQYVNNETWMIPDCSFTYPGHSFLGWGEAPEGPVRYLPGDLAYNDGNMSLFAIWGPMSADELAALYTPRVNDPSYWNVNATVDEQTGIRYMTAKLGWSQLTDVDQFAITLNLGAADGPRVPSLATIFSVSDGSVSTSWSTSYATVAVPFVADGEEQVITDGAVNGVVDGDVVYATVASHFDGGDAPGNPVFFVCKLPYSGPETVDQVSWFAESGNGTVEYADYYTVTLTEDTVLPEGGLQLGNNSYHINMNTHTLTGKLICGWSDLYIEHLTPGGRILAANASNEQTIMFDGYAYFNGQSFGTATVTLSDYARFNVDSAYMAATVTNGANIGTQDASDFGNYANAQPLTVYERAPLTEEELADHTPKNVTVTPMQDGLIVECDYEPDARTININVDVLLSDGNPARLITDSHSSGKDQVMSLEGDRQPFFISTRVLSDEEKQEISENGEQKYVNGFHGGDRLSVTMNFEMGPQNQGTPWSDPPVSFVYGSAAIGRTFEQGFNATVPRNFLPDMATITVTSPLEVPYNGSFQTLEYTVALADGTELELGVDYTEEYLNNWDPGTATLAVIGLGDYSGRMTQPFTILGIDLGSEEVTATLAYDSAVYTGGSLMPSVMLTYEGRVLKQSSEYYLDYSDNVEVGTATVTVTPGYNGVTTGTRTLTFSILPRSMESDALYVTLAQNRFVWTGEAVEPPLSTVRWGATALTEDTDYTLSYENNVNVGTGCAVLTGKGSYAGEVRVPFTIYQPVSLATAATIDAIAPQVYTGAALTPKVTVRVGNTVLTEGWDYAVSYNNNVSAGTAAVTVTGRRDYTGIATADFTIDPADIGAGVLNLYKNQYYNDPVYTYSGLACEPYATITLGGRTLYSPTDFTLTYLDNVNAGTAKAVAVGAGNYGGTKTQTFTISPLNVNDVYTARADSVTYNAQAQTTKVHLFLNSFDEMVEGVDFTLSGWSNNVNAGTATVTVTGQGNCTGTRTLEYTVSPLQPNLSYDFELTYDKYVYYTGSPVTPNLQIKWKLNGRTLVEGTDYTVEYDDNLGYGGHNHTDPNGSVGLQINFQGNFMGENHDYYFAIVDPGTGFTGASGTYDGTAWSISEDGTLTVRGGVVLADLSYHNDVAWRPYRDHIKKIVVQQGIAKLTAGAFADCHFATEAVLPEGLTEISYSVFTGCESLKTINIPSTVTKINAGTFTDVQGLEIHLPDNITAANMDGYFGDFVYTKVFVKRGTDTAATLLANGSYFYYEGYPDFKLSYSLNSDQGLVCWKYVGTSSNVVVPNFVEALNSTFAGTSIVERVVVPASVRTMGYGNMMPFEYCYGLRELVFEPGNNLTELRSYSFYGCNDLTVYIPDNITSIGTVIINDNVDIIFVANCDSYAIEWAKSQMRWNSHIWADETERTTGPRYRLLHKNPVEHAGQAATCTEPGWTDYITCAACGYNSRQELPALGHAWSDVTYTWSDDHAQVTATRTCAHDAAHVETETVASFATVVAPATCVAEGEIKYSSDVFANPAFRVQVLAAALPTSGHSAVSAPSTAAGNGQNGLRGGDVCAVCGETLHLDRTVSADKVFTVPAMIKTIESEAFYGVAAQQITVPSGATSIGDGAFGGSDSLLLVVLPASVTTIEGNPFTGSDVAVICPDNCSIATWCDDHSIPHNP